MNLLRSVFNKVRPRMRPHFIIIGAQKAGTSALFEMFRRHPKALPPDAKELYYFSDDSYYAKGYRAYRKRFPHIPIKARGHFTFEASPGYLYHAERSAPRIAKDLPEAYCVAILRDPVKRAYSAWNMFRNFEYLPDYRHLHDSRSFAQAVEDEFAGRTEHNYHKYLACGRYSEQLAHFMTHVAPGQLIIKSYRSLKDNPYAFTNELLDQLSLPRVTTNTPLHKVKANVHPYVDKLDPSLAKELYAYFTSELEKLNNLLGQELDIWEQHG